MNQLTSFHRFALQTRRVLRLEPLEDRTVPTVDWIGGNASWTADVNNWFDTVTSTNHFPGPTDDVRINNGATVTFNAGTHTIRSLAVSAASQLLLTAGTITNSTDLSVSADAAFKLQGGVLANATVLSGSTLTGTVNGGTLNNVTLGGTLDLRTQNASYTYITNNLTLNNGTINLGSVGVTPTYGAIHFYNSGPQTLGGTGTVNFGDNTSNGIFYTAATATDQLTFQAGVALQGAGGLISGNGGYDFQGTFTIDPTTVGSTSTTSAITIEGTNWVNNGTLQALHGGTLNLRGTWSNTGLLTQTNSTINLGGQFSTPAVNGLVRSGGTVNVLGKLLNTGHTLLLNNNTGSWNLGSNSVLEGGTLKATAGNGLIGATGAIDGVTIDGTGGNASPLDLSSTNNSYVYVYGGLTLNSATINIGSVGATPNYGYLYFYYDGAQTLGGTGAINFGDHGNNAIYYYDSVTANKLTVSPGVVIQGATGTITGNAAVAFQGTVTSDPTTVGSVATNSLLQISSATWANEGTMQALHGGTLTLSGTWSNTGVLTETNSTLNLSGVFPTAAVTGVMRSGGTVNLAGRLVNTGNTLLLNNTTGSWNLVAPGILEGGTLKTTAGSALFGRSGSLMGVTLDGTGGNVSPLDLSTMNASYAYVYDGLFLNNATINLGTVGAGANYGYLHFYYDGSQTLGGTGTINFGDNGSNAIYFYDNVVTNKLTIGPGVRVQGAYGIITGNAGFEFQGTVKADPTSVGSALTNTTLTLYSSSWSNDGTLEAGHTGQFTANGTLTNIVNGVLTGGTWGVSSGGIMRLVDTQIASNAATVVLDGATSAIYNNLGTSHAFANLTSNTGSLTIRNGQTGFLSTPFANSGSLTVGPGSQVTTRAQFASSASATSQYSTGNWSAAQAIGASNTTFYGDYPTSWAPASANIPGTILTVGFAAPDFADGAIIRETLGNGFVTRIDALDTDDVLHTVWTGIDPSTPGVPFDFLASWPRTSYAVKGLQIYVDTSHTAGYEEIDSVQLISASTSVTNAAGNTTIEAGGTLTLPGKEFIQSSGTTTVHGTLTSGTTNLQGGLLQGSGTLTSNVTNAAQVAPGPNTAVLTIDGNYTQTSAGSLNIDLGGLTAGTQYDQLAVNGSVDLAGALHVALVGPYVPLVDDQFLILNKTNAGSSSGDLGFGENTTFMAGTKFHITYAGTDLGADGNDIVLSTSNIAPTLDAIPDPAPILENAGLQTINLSGIAAGGPETQNLTVTAVSSNPAIVPNPTVSYTSPNTTGSLSYTPTANVSGIAVITVTVQDDAGTAHLGVDKIVRTFTVEVGYVNHAPTFTKGADQIVLEDAGRQTVPNWATNIDVGQPEDIGQTLTFLVSTNNDALFSVLPSIDPTTGTLTYTPAANANGSATVTVRLKDDGGTDFGGSDTSAPQTFTISVTPVNDTPVLDVNPTPLLPFIPVFNSKLPPAGAPISELTQNVSDIDAGALQGIAITGVDNLKGKWQFNLIGTGAWTDITGVSETNALLLASDSDTLLRFLPNKGFTGFASLTYKAWDRSGLLPEGNYDNITASSAYSTATERGWIAVGKTTPTIDPDGRTVLKPTLPVYKPTSKVVALATVYVKDILGLTGKEATASTTLGAAITGADNSEGTWQYQLAKTKTWTNINGVSATSALLLRPLDKLRYLPTLTSNGAAPLTFKTWESLGSTEFGTQVNPVGAAFGNTTGTAVLDLVPILDLSVPATLNPINAVQTTDAASFASMMSASRLVGTNEGVAITATKGTGTWEYSLNGVTWTPVGKVSVGAALFLTPEAQIRYVAASTPLAGTASLSFKAWDETKFAPGTRGAASGTLVSKETEIVTVAIGNQAPTLDTTPDVNLPSVKSSSLKPSAGTLIKTFLAKSITDPNGPTSLQGIAITGVDNTNGQWQYSLGSNIWSDVGVVSADSAVLLKNTAKLRFVPNAGFVGTATISYKAWDQTVGQAGDRIDTDSGLNSFSLAVETATINITA